MNLSTGLPMGVFVAACIIAAAFLMNKNKVIGILAGITSIIGIACGQYAVNFLKNYDMIRYVTGSSQSEVNDKIMDVFMESLIDTIPLSIACLLFMVGWVLTLVFIVKSMKLKPKVLPLFALILQILAYLFQCTAYSVPLVRAIFEMGDGVSGMLTEFFNILTKGSEFLTNACLILAPVLVLVAAILARVGMKKQPAAAVVVEASAEEDVELPADEELEIPAIEDVEIPAEEDVEIPAEEIAQEETASADDSDSL